jgi:hypothetical protein
MQKKSGAFTLLSNAGATGSAVAHPGGKVTFVAEATWGGGTVKLQWQNPLTSTWIDVPSMSLTANGMLTSTVPAGNVRANVATATAVYASLVYNQD